MTHLRLAQPLAAFAALLWILLGARPAAAEFKSSTVPEVVVHAEPARLVFDAATAEATVELVNTGDVAVELSGIRIDGADWQGFAVTDGGGTRLLAPGGRAAIRVHLDHEAFRAAPEEPPSPDAAADDDEGADDEESAEPEGWRDGRAHLRYRAGLVDGEVSLRFQAPSLLDDWILPALLKVVLLVMAFIMPMASLLTWLERKQSALMQDRVGPNMASIPVFGMRLRLWGLLHIAADGLKMLFKEDLVPARVHRALYDLAPALALVPALVVFAIVPFGDGLCYGQLGEVLHQADIDQCVAGRGGTALQVAHLDMGLLFYFAIASIASYGATLAGWSSYNKWAMMGGLRASAQMISYEVAIGLTIVGALLVYGSLEPHALVRAQIESHWGILLQPIALILFFTAGTAETKRAPFDLPEGESEIIGYFLEYSGMRFGLFFLGEFVEVVFLGAMVTTLFLGGWSLPFGMLGASGFTSALACQAFFAGGGVLLLLMGIGAWRASPHSENVGVVLVFLGVAHITVALWSAFTGWGTALPHLAVVLVGMITWGIKIALLCWFQLLIRWTLPRFRYDQLMTLGWKGLLPLSITNIVFTAVVVYFLLPGPGHVP